MKKTLRECISKLKEITDETTLEEIILYLQNESKGKLLELYCNEYTIRIRIYKVYIYPLFTTEYNINFYIEIYNDYSIWLYFNTIKAVTYRSIIEHLTNIEKRL